MSSKIYSVETVKLTVSGAASFRVDAAGSTNTSGWTHPELKPSAVEPEGTAGGNTIHLDFVATAPTGIVLEVITPITASTELPAPGPGQTLTVIVHAATNEASGSGNSPIAPP